MARPIYSVPSWPYDGLKKKDLLELGFEKVCDIWKENALPIYRTRPHFPEEYNYHQGIFRTALQLTISRLTGRALHVFLESEQLLDFLMTAPVKEIMIGLNLIDKFYTDEDIGQFVGYRSEERTDYSTEALKKGIPEVKIRMLHVLIHHKRLSMPSIQYAVGCAMPEGRERDIKDLSSLTVIDGGTPFQIHMNSEQREEPLARLFYNLCMYVEAFPDCLVDGSPDEVKAFNIFYHAGKNRRIKLATHESLIDRSGVTPHFRRGHFRRLMSEHWTKKRGQVVFVRSTFVKGKAETVLDSEEHRKEMVLS